LSEIVTEIRDFNESRGWRKYHTVSNVILAIVREIGELIEHFRWKPDDWIPDEKTRDTVALEIADIFIYLVTLSYEVGVDLEEAVTRKLAINLERFPPELDS